MLSTQCVRMIGQILLDKQAFNKEVYDPCIYATAKNIYLHKDKNIVFLGSYREVQHIIIADESNIFYSFGHIDCRLEEGIYTAKSNKGDIAHRVCNSYPIEDIIEKLALHKEQITAVKQYEKIKAGLTNEKH